MSFLKQKHILSLLFLTLCWITPKSTFSQVSVAKTTTDSISTDSLSNDSTQAKPQKKKKPAIDFPISYKATDSIVLMQSGNAFLYGSGNINYEKIDLTADYIALDFDSSTVYAIGKLNEDGEEIGKPIFKDGDEEYASKSIRYNIKTKKGYILQGVVQQGEGYIIGEKTKKIDENIICMKNGKYTTCDEHDHPHFYLNLTKAKVKNKKWIVTGPAYLVLLDVPLPLALPFGYFPFTKEYSSGVIVPSYGQDITRGFYLTNGGYYWAINDYMDLSVTGDIYTMGTWALNGLSSYVKRYKYRGNINVNYREDVTGIKELPNEYSKAKNFSFNWTHAQDAKASPNSTISASVNFSTSGYDRSNINNYYNPSLLSQNTKSSSISWGYRFPESPFSISTNVLANQRTADSTIMLTLPDFSINMTRIYPLKRKNAIGKDRWYEKISISYNGRFSNSIETKEDLLLKSSFLKDWKNGADHVIPVNMSFNILKYISISPNINYHERWNFKSVEKSWDTATNKVINDTINGFNRVYDFNAGVSASTKFYGFFTPNRKIFGDKIDRIRHVITPSVGFSYKPDFGDPFWNLYKTYDRPTSLTDPTLTSVLYSPDSIGLFGIPSVGETGSITFSLNNNLEMKVKQKNDTTDNPYKTISLIDGISVNGSYNLAADSMNWSNFNANLRLKLFKGLNINLSGAFETYLYALNSAGNPVRINTPRWEVGKFPRLISTGTSCGYTFNNQTFKKKETEAEKDSTNTPTTNSADEEGYQTIKVPWSLSFDYSVQYGNTIFNKEILEYDREITHNMSVRGNINVTSKWSINFGGAYDITNKTITYTNLGISRNLHCWNMSANIVPFGVYKTYNFLIQVNSSLLSDLKYEKRSDFTTPINWY
ncbi:MAG: LPS-assembly protein LptD [Paludibacteraceae bacterium]|nr:LPS-assembly protein LptD [Paludibacteraceae bacterium]MBN2787595.1 LPS-assembly protein LptD [Paludibacteraceae bacterium]